MSKGRVKKLRLFTVKINKEKCGVVLARTRVEAVKKFRSGLTFSAILVRGGK